MSQTYDQDNIFAKLLRNEIPSIRVYEDDDVVAFMDVMPQTTGHTLVVPKKASRNILDADPQILEATIKIVQKIAKAIKKAFNAEGITILQFNEKSGGQTVFHLHFHVMPRFEGDKLLAHNDTMETSENLEKAAQKIREAL
ncbi:HIT family protein [Bartonella tamiae]|uniref:HIT domain-containing protein n=1 Tax=Bartonella tamiae Th239 TaxID=1094558 RepID=J0ZJX5_9HYPH|nr:HIT family protein [Bartonella tamiae]EJF88623.1 hypothetical protein ME5_01174 [Bartonella tamiae Th239]EJF95127.1 hypothetical protein MEG_00708 [Bartonella tamiae Th307]